MPDARVARRLFPAVAVTALTYVVVVLLFDRREFGIWFGIRNVAVLLGAGSVVLLFGTRWILGRFPATAGAFVNAALLLGVLVVCMVVSDTAVAAYGAVSNHRNIDSEAQAAIDPVPFAGELYPRYYFPGTQFFRLYKPGTSATGDHYGMIYFPRLAQSKTLKDSVFQLEHVTVSINADGIRDHDAFDQCHVAAIGDSFTFGNGVTDGATWPDLLESHIGQCVLNLGMSGAAPKEEMLSLRYQLHAHPKASIHTIVWMIYEANDLEDGHADTVPVPKPPGVFARVRSATVLGGAYALVHSFADQSWLRKLREGQLSLAAQQSAGANAYMIDGVPLNEPLFHSSKFGYMFAYQLYLDRAAKPESYVLNEPNRPAIDRAFRDMAALADSIHAKVYVVLMPSAIRVYANDFPWLPAPSAEPHFLNYAAGLARKNGLTPIALLPELKPFAKDSLLYFRDDDHLNRYGNQVVAELLGRHLEKERVAGSEKRAN